MYITQVGCQVYVRYAAAGKAHFMRDRGGVWHPQSTAWVFDAASFDAARFRIDYENAAVLSVGKIIRKEKHGTPWLRDEYKEALAVMQQDKDRWLTGDVPCDEKMPINTYSCPFSERGDASAGLVVCFVGWRPCIVSGKLLTDGRYGYIIGENAAVCERLSSIRRRVGALLNASCVRLISPLDAPVIRGVCVFDVGLYGTRNS